MALFLWRGEALAEEIVTLIAVRKQAIGALVGSMETIRSGLHREISYAPWHLTVHLLAQPIFAFAIPFHRPCNIS